MAIDANMASHHNAVGLRGRMHYSSAGKRSTQRSTDYKQTLHRTLKTGEPSMIPSTQPHCGQRANPPSAGHAMMVSSRVRLFA